MITLERSTALTAPDAIDTGTPFPGVAQTTLIICGWPDNNRIPFQSKQNDGKDLITHLDPKAIVFFV